VNGVYGLNEDNDLFDGLDWIRASQHYIVASSHSTLEWSMENPRSIPHQEVDAT
jgi:hypothetical protein